MLVISPAHKLALRILATNHGDTIYTISTMSGLSLTETSRLLNELTGYGYASTTDGAYFQITDKTLDITTNV